MPTLQLLADGKDAARVLARMHFPKNERELGVLFAWFTCEDVAESAVQPASRKRDVLLRMSDVGWRGTVAGEILLRVAAMSEFGLEEPSVRKAIYSWKRHAIKLRTLEDGELSIECTDKAIAITEKSGWNYHAEFETVRHLWAAHRILERDTPFYEVLETLTDAQAMQRFLAHAAWFLDFEASHGSRNHHDGPLLDRSVAWVCVPAPPALKPDLEPVRESLTSDLDGYRATKSFEG